jgi:hypothetical protein
VQLTCFEFVFDCTNGRRQFLIDTPDLWTKSSPVNRSVFTTARWPQTAGGALAAAGVRFGLHPTTVLIVPGLAWAAVMTAHSGWRGCGTGLAVAVVGTAGAFAGPAGAWAVAGVGLCAVLLGKAAAVAWRQRRSVARA